MKRFVAVFFVTSLTVQTWVYAASPRLTGGWGRLEFRLQDQDTVWVVTVSGTPYEMGYWYGKLLTRQIANNLNHFLEVAYMVVNPDLLNVVANLLMPYVPARYVEMMHGLADACADHGHPEIDMSVLKKIMAIPDFSESGCSLWAAYGPATNGHTYQMRNLDWAMTTGLQDFPVVAVFLPADSLGNPTGEPHATVGFAGVFGAIAGLNASGVAVSEIAGYFHDREILVGEPMLYLLWDVLWETKSAAEAESLIFRAHRTNMYYYAVSDGFSPGSRVRLFFTGHDSAFAHPDGVPVHRSYLLEPDAFYQPLPGAIYWKNHNGDGNRLLYDELRARYGRLDDSGAIEIARKAGVPATLVSAVTDGTDLELYVSFAHGPRIPAHVRKYVHLNLRQYFNSKPLTRAPDPRRADKTEITLEVYPNPFNTTAMLLFRLKGSQSAKLTVFELSGRQVMSWRLRGPGGTIRWQPSSDLASGLYLIRLETAACTVQRKVVYVK